MYYRRLKIFYSTSSFSFRITCIHFLKFKSLGNTFFQNSYLIVFLWKELYEKFKYVMTFRTPHFQFEFIFEKNVPTVSFLKRVNRQIQSAASMGLRWTTCIRMTTERKFATGIELRKVINIVLLEYRSFPSNFIDVCRSTFFNRWGIETFFPLLQISLTRRISNSILLRS